MANQTLYDEQNSISHRIENSYNQFEADDAKNIFTCKTRLENLNELWIHYEHNYYEILKLPNNKKTQYIKQDFFSTVEQNYLKNKSLFVEYIAKHSEDINSTHNSHSSTLRNESFIGAEDSERLPRISVPKFKGDYTQWEHFKDLFCTLVGDKFNLSKVSKLHYLITSLEGEPLQLVKSYPITSENYEIVWRKLVDKYDNKRRLVSSHLSKIFNLNPMKKESSFELKRILTGIITPIQALSLLKRETKHWDDFLVFHTVNLFDPQTRKQWEKYLGTLANAKDPPSFAEMEKFIENQIVVLESLEDSYKKNINSNFGNSNFNKSNKSSSFNVVNNSNKIQGDGKPETENSTNGCIICKGSHLFSYCDAYKNKSVEERKQFVISKNRCTNCLNLHTIFKCQSKNRCKICNGKHHITLHIAKKSNGESSSHLTTETENNNLTDHTIDDTNEVNFDQSEQVAHLCSFSNSVLLATAIVKVYSEDEGNFITVRALIDNCSQSSFVSEFLCQSLNLNYKSIDLPVSGVGGNKNCTCKKFVNINICPNFDSDFTCNLDALVLPRVSNYAPNIKSKIQYTHLEKLRLADPEYLYNKRVDILLGSSIYSKIIQKNIKKGKENEPIAQKTVFGWIVSGDTGNPVQNEKSIAVYHIADELKIDTLLQKFWEQEEFSNKKILTDSELANEEFFQKTYCRTSDGRFMVCLPFNIDKSKIYFPNSYERALKIYQSMERKFHKDKKLHNMCIEFFIDYLKKGHMREINSSEIPNCKYFIPWHGILREDHLTTKYRNVFNGSSETSNGLSLNKVCHTGENLLKDLTSLIISWRKYKFVFISDIKQMYRQILIHPDDQFYQAIIWRENKSQPIKVYLLNTVTYGLVSSPYLAIRCLKQLAEDEKSKYPQGADIINNEVYMDDSISGGHTIEETLEKINQFKCICKLGGFELHKYLSNNQKILESIDASDRALSDSEFNENFDSGILGLKWNPKGDFFFFQINLSNIDELKKKLSKRQVLANIAKLFDPLGLLAPVIITAKIFMQKLWLHKLTWDSQLPDYLVSDWLSWYSKLHLINSVKINRWLNFSPGVPIIELHGFADASKSAYAAVVYLRLIYGNGETFVNILQSKTKVAPIKKVLTIPKLELCAAVLLARLVKKLLFDLDLPECSVHLWTDSKDVLYWLRDHPSKWKIYIGNRSSKIHNYVPQAQWRHVKSKENPADCASRGLSVDEFINFDLWWKGPSWINDNSDPFQFISEPNNVEIVDTISSHICSYVNETNSVVSKYGDLEIINKYSSINKLLTVMGYVLRFISKLLIKTKSRLLNKSNLFANKWFCGNILETQERLNAFEISRAKLVCIFLVQHIYYYKQFISLSKSGRLESTDNLLNLDPYVEDNLLRVGGRLSNALLHHDEMHPFILPYDSHLSYLIARRVHYIQTIHGGLKLSLATLRQQCWVIKGRYLIKKIIRECVTCLRYRGSTLYQKMGNLPSFRLKSGLDVFSHVGVDYAGPFNIKASKYRGIKTYKAYIALFICLNTRAIHLELVESYDSADFIAAFRRFTSTRGECLNLYSDQGTTFVGAAKEISNLFKKSSEHMKDIIHVLKYENVTWHFNPPAAPNFGGSWESAVKSTKHHLKRVIADQILTFNQFNTLLKQIEACLNSRPILALNDDITDLQVLTPFQLIAKSNKPAYILPDQNYLINSKPPLKIWHRIQYILQCWWKNWLLEYLQSLQTRDKWKIAQNNLKIGDIVLITDNNIPPAKWPFAKVLKIYPGNDNLVRVVKIQTTKSQLKRPINKLILINKSEE